MPEVETYLGAIDDPRPIEEQERNYSFRELVAAANPVQWVEKSQPSGMQYDFMPTTWRRFPVRNQDGSGSCVAQTLAKLMGILAYLRWGVFIVFSAGHIYLRRKNKPSGGMWADDAYQIAQRGVTFEELMPSMAMNDAQMDALYESDLHKKVNLAISNYIWLPVGDLETVASVIQTTKKGVMTWHRFAYNEWGKVPKVLVSNPTNHHSVAGVDFTLFEAEKSIVIDESWGEGAGTETMNGQRVLKESWYKARNTHASYPMDFKFDTENTPTPVPHVFSEPLVFIPLDLKTQEILPEYVATHEAQEADVARLQDILKKEGLFPSNVPSTGLYQEITRKAVLAFQYRYMVASEQELIEVNGKRVGSKTIAKLNELYGS